MGKSRRDGKGRLAANTSFILGHYKLKQHLMKTEDGQLTEQTTGTWSDEKISLFIHCKIFQSPFYWIHTEHCLSGTSDSQTEPRYRNTVLTLGQNSTSQLLPCNLIYFPMLLLRKIKPLAPIEKKEHQLWFLFSGCSPMTLRQNLFSPGPPQTPTHSCH